MELLCSNWQYIIITNLLGYMTGAHEAVKRMKDTPGAHIANIGSISAQERGKDSSVYVATKGFKESLRKEVRPAKTYTCRHLHRLYWAHIIRW